MQGLNAQLFGGGIAHQFDPAANVGTGCIPIFDHEDGTHTLWLLDLDGADTIARQPFADFAVGESYEVTTEDVVIGGSPGLRCGARAISAAQQLTIEGKLLTANGTLVGLRTRGTTSRFDYVIVIAER